MPAEDIGNILSRTSRQVYITQEVIYGENEAVQAEEYLENGDCVHFHRRFCAKLIIHSIPQVLFRSSGTRTP